MYMFEKWRKQQNSTDRASVGFLNGWFCDKLMTIAFLSYQFISACSLSLPSQSWCLYSKSTGPISKIIQKHPLIFREISPLGPVVARSLAPMPPMPGGGTGAPEPQVSKSCLSSRQRCLWRDNSGVTNLAITSSYNAHKFTIEYLYIYILSFLSFYMHCCNIICHVTCSCNMYVKSLYDRATQNQYVATLTP